MREKKETTEMSEISLRETKKSAVFWQSSALMHRFSLDFALKCITLFPSFHWTRFHPMGYPFLAFADAKLLEFLSFFYFCVHSRCETIEWNLLLALSQATLSVSPLSRLALEMKKEREKTETPIVAKRTKINTKAEERLLRRCFVCITSVI